MSTDREFNRRMVKTVLTVAGLLTLLAALWVARDALMLIYVSCLIAMGFSPLVKLIQHPGRWERGRRVPRVLAILTVYLAIIGIVGLIALLVVPALIDQATALWEHLPEHFNDLQRILIRSRLMTRAVTLQEAVQSGPVGGGNPVGTVITAITSVLGGVFGVITIVILSFYLLIEAEGLMRTVTRFVPQGQRAHFAAAARRSVDKVSAWLRAQMTLAAVMGTLAAVGLGILHVPYFYVVALVAAAGETIPVLGPLIAGVTAVVIALGVSPKLALITGAYVVVLHQLESNILVPKIMERRVGVSPVVVLIALLVGGSLYGLLGAILAIPTAAIISVVVEEFGLNHAEEADS
jgi:predicted PurR-regulated permease PerM